MRVLLDTNVLVSAILYGGLPMLLVEGVIRGELVLVTSSHLLDEFEDVLRVKFELPVEFIRIARTELESMSDFVEAPRVRRILRDPDDDHVLAAAEHGGAEAIVTGDRDLLDHRAHEGIPIMTVTEFVGESGG